MSIDFPLVAKVIALPRAGSKSAKDKEQRRLCDTLYHEYNVCVNNFQDLPQLPRRPLRFYGEAEGNRYLVMEKLERDLLSVAKEGNATLREVARLGTQILEGLRQIHNKGFFFVDIKPDNFMVKENKLYFVDFGLVEKRPNSMAGLYGAQDAGREFAGTATYASIEALSGKPPSVSDEIQSMVYVLLAVLNGAKLPWSIAKSDSELLRLKQSTDIRSFANSLDAGELAIIFQEARNGIVDYDRFGILLQSLANKNAPAKKTSGNARSSESKTRNTVVESNEILKSDLTSEDLPKRKRRVVAAAVDSEMDDDATEKKTSSASNRKRGAVAVPQTVEEEPVSVPSSRRGRLAFSNKASIEAKADSTVLTEESVTSDSSLLPKRGRLVKIVDKLPISQNKGTAKELSDFPASKKRSKPEDMQEENPQRKRSAVPSKISEVSERAPFIDGLIRENNRKASRKVPSPKMIEVDPEDILGLEDGVPTYWNACIDEETSMRPQQSNMSAMTGPFSIRKSEYHRHRLSSFGGEANEEHKLPVKSKRSKK
jgi:serine/threonine protein kinase